MRASPLLTPAANVTNRCFPITDGDAFHLFDLDRQKYVLDPYADGKWSAEPPVVSAGESFWVAKAKPGNWTRNLVIGGEVTLGSPKPNCSQNKR